MDILKVFLLLIFLASRALFASDGFVIDRVKVICLSGKNCSDFRNKYNELKGDDLTNKELRNKIRFYLLDKAVKHFEYKVIKSSKLTVLEIRVARKKILGSVEFISNVKVDFSPLKKQLELKIGQSYDDSNLVKSEEIIRKYYKDRGFSDLKLSFDEVSDVKDIHMNINISVGKLLHVKNVVIEYADGAQRFKDIEKVLYAFKGEPWNKFKFLYEVDQVSSKLFEQGYFFANAKNLEPEFLKDNKYVILKVNIKSGKRYNFSFTGNKIFTYQSLLQRLKDNIRNSFGDFSVSELKNILSRFYEEKGVFNTVIYISLRNGVDRNGRNYNNYYVNISEGQKISISKLSFIGNRKFPIKEIKELYYDRASVLAKRDFLDLNFSAEFSNILKNEYLKKGFIFSVVDEPLYNFKKESNTVVVEYKIKERQQNLVESITIDGAGEDLKKLILPKLINKVGEPLNVVDLEKDLAKTIEVARNHGYFYANITNVGNKNLIQYESNYSRSRIVIKLNAGKKTIFDSSLITGQNKTKINVIEREIDLKPGDLLTPAKVKEVRNRIYSLGLFSLVRVSPFVKSSKDLENYHVNLLVQLQEKDFGAGEIAPGYRSDIGFKLSTGMSYNNLWGKNHSISGKLQANLRDNFNNLDDRRRTEEKRMLEYSINTQYSYPYLFYTFLGTKLDFDISSSFRRKRFFDFDADIFKFSPRLSKQFTKYFNASVKYQFETINQFDATDDIDNDSFRIGGITPSISFDFRDNPIAPTKGAFLSLSWEFANSIFGSMKEENLEVNFSRLVSRNNFYIPLSRNFILASNISVGYEKNYANEFRLDTDGNEITNGFIPSVKVFRLDGADSVRGFRNKEINLLENGEDIGNVVIRDKAFFSNIKIEPRYYVSDALVIGAFFDAGRVFINSFKPLSLRTSAGATLKLLTPVGSLNLDYGVKLRRKTLPSGSKESFGRFHLSIGFF